MREATKTDATNWKAGSAVFITLIVKKNSDRVLHFLFGDPISDYSFHVSDVRWGRPAVTGKYQELEREHKSTSAAVLYITNSHIDELKRITEFSSHAVYEDKSLTG